MIQVQELIGDDIFAIKKREYLGEVRMRKGENIAIFPCEIFHRRRKPNSWEDKETNSIDIDNKNGDFKPDFWRYCFDYVTSNMKGSINTTTTFCMPAKLKGNFKNNRMIKIYRSTIIELTSTNIIIICKLINDNLDFPLISKREWHLS